MRNKVLDRKMRKCLEMQAHTEQEEITDIIELKVAG